MNTISTLITPLSVTIAIMLGVALFVMHRRGRRQATREVDNNKRLEALVENLQGGIITCDVIPETKALKVTYLSEGWARLTGYGYDELNELFGGNPQLLIYHEDIAQCAADYAEQVKSSNKYRVEYRFTHKDGTLRWALDRGVVVRNDRGGVENQSIITDLTDIKQHAEELATQAQTEPMTGLYHKVSAKHKVEALLRENAGALNATLLIDIDDFKNVNDTMGHTFGDMVIIDVANRLKTTFGGKEIVARIGGDEFMVFIPNVADEEQALDAASRICNAFHVNYSTEPQGYKISCSVGVVCTDELSYHTLVDLADLAMYDAKYLGKDRFAVYDKDRVYTNQRSIAREPEPEHAIDKNISDMVFDLLYSTADFVGSINMMLAFLCNSFGFTYSYIFETTRDCRIAINTFEWTFNTNKLQLPTLAPLDAEVIEQYKTFFKTNRYYYSADVTNYDAYSQTALELRKINAILHLPLMQGNEFKGIVGFCKADPYDKPDDAKISSLLHIMKILCTFITKERDKDELYAGSLYKAHAMDCLPVPVYVTDNENRILFMNKLIANSYPDARIGDKCYEKFMDRDSPCVNCPKLRCGEGIASSRMINSEGVEDVTTAQQIEWEGKSAYLVMFQIVDDLLGDQPAV